MSYRLLAVDISNSGVPPADANIIDSYVPVTSTGNTTLFDTWTRLTTTGTGIINILLWVAGLILTISVIMHATTYITSGGDAQKAGAARQGLTNAALGLIVVSLTFVIMRAIVAIVQ